MSAFIVDTKTMHRVVWAIVNNTKSFAGMTIEQDGASRIGQRLFQLNAAAVNYRYGDDEVVQDIRYSYRPQPMTMPVQAYKAIQCFLYQCSEGEQFETSAEYLDLVALSDRLAHAIVQRLPAYNAAEWG